jgi:hypothetical protein
MMRKHVIAVSVAAAVAFAGLLFAQEAKGPRIEFKEMRFDLGKVVQGTQASHMFEVMSAGSDTLVIDRVQTA